MHLVLLFATLAALLSGPLLYACARTRPPLLALLDGFLLVSISGLVLLEAVPGTFTSGGAISAVFLLLGLLGPSALEHWLRRAQREAHLATLLLALLGLLVHSIGDGIALSSGGDLGEGLALPLAVALHSVPVGLVVWWLLFPVFGAAPPSIAIASMCVATIAGFVFGPALGAQLGHSGWAWFQALVAGSILHVVFGRPHLDPHDSGASDSPHFEGLGNLLALVGLIALEQLGHGHEHAEPSALAASFFAIFIALAQWLAPLLLAAYLIGGLLRIRQGWAAALQRGARQLVDASAAWTLVLLALVAVVLPRLLPDLELPHATLAHRVAFGVVLALFAASLLRRGGRAWIGDLWPRNARPLPLALKLRRRRAFTREMPMDLQDKVIVVTGAGQGIGRALATCFAGAGANVALIDLHADALAETQRQCEALGARAWRYACNVSDETAVEQTMDAIVADAGRLDGLINNAGILKDALLVKVKDGEVVNRMSLAQWQAVIDVNLTGVFLCGRAAAERMIGLGNGGVIINISSISRHGNAGQTNYSAAKAGVAAMAVVWAQELGRHGIRAASIAPGFVATDILSAMKPEMLDKMLAPVPMKRLGEAAEIAKAARFIFENDFFTGRCLDLDGGLRL